MKLKSVIMAILALTLTISVTSGYRILGLFPYYGRSHFIMFKSVMEGLAKRGHQVDVLSHYPRETPLENYTDLSVRGSMPLPNNARPFALYDSPKYDIFNLLTTALLYRRIDQHEDVMKVETVQRLMKSKERYDLIITEAFVVDMMLGFVHKFKTPLIFLSSCGMPPWTSDFMANPQNPAFVPHFLSQSSPKMSFFERALNAAGLLTNLIAWYGFFVPQNERLMRKYFGEDTPPLLDITRNASLILTNTDSTIFGARPVAPTVVQVGGVHLEAPKKLPKDIEDFLENSAHGVIYFCMGSFLKAASLPDQKKNAFLDAFSKMKERVLWKFEDDSIAKFDNIMVKAWMPQRDILAHPKVKLFITHGGLLGTLEAVSEGKPMIGIPIVGDQFTNVMSLQLQGVTKYVPYDSIDNDTIFQAIQEMLKPKYAENAKRLAKLFHDRPMSPMDTAAYWIEYVVRNKGARNLRSPAVDLAFYQYLLLDVIAFYTCCAILVVLLMYYTFKIAFFRRKLSKNMKGKLKNK